MTFTSDDNAKKLADTPTNRQNYKITGADVSDDISLTTRDNPINQSTAYNRVEPQEAGVLANVKPRKKFTFTYVNPWVIDFEGMPETSSRVKWIVDNYDYNGYYGYMNGAWQEADRSGHQCGPNHDESVKWKLRDIQNYNLNPIMNKVNDILGRINNESCLTGDCLLNDRIEQFNNRIALLNAYNANLGTPEQIQKNISSYYKYLIDAVNADRKIIENNDGIIVYTNLQYDAAAESAAINDKLLKKSISAQDAESASLFESSKDKIKKYNEEIESQNNILIDKSNKVKDYYTKTERDFEHQQSNIPFLGTVKNFFFVTFYVLIFGLIVLCFYAKSRYDLIWRIFIVLLFCVFPFIAYDTEMFLYNMFMYLYSFILNRPFNNDNVDYNPTKGDPHKGDVLSLNHLKTTDGEEKEPIDRTNNFDDLQKNNFEFLPTNSIIGGYNYFNKIYNSFNLSGVTNSLVNGM